jgi:hypothetical protein
MRFLPAPFFLLRGPARREERRTQVLQSLRFGDRGVVGLLHRFDEALRPGKTRIALRRGRKDHHAANEPRVIRRGHTRDPVAEACSATTAGPPPA